MGECASCIETDKEIIIQKELKSDDKQNEQCIIIFIYIY